MIKRRTVDLLPDIFRTSPNRQFLSATLDQMTQEPSIKRSQGYVGRRVGPGVNPADNYIVEPTAARSNYQLEPGVTFLDPNTEKAVDAITYPGMLDALRLQNGNVTRQDRLFESQYYTYDPFCDLDKFSNYSQYYWLPSGPDSVDVFATEVPFTDDFEVLFVRTTTGAGYQFSGVGGNNPVITLARGGNYTFEINQPGRKFWIQSQPGVSGRLREAPNISSRDVFGVINNGIESGTIQFLVPQRTAQDYFYTLPEVGPVDLITTIPFNDINNVYVDEFLTQYPDGIDGITQLDGRTLVFDNTITDATDGGWLRTTRFDPLPSGTSAIVVGGFQTTDFDQTEPITSQDERYSVWRITYVTDTNGRAFMTLSSVQPVPTENQFRIRYGDEYSNTRWYKNTDGFFERMPLLTAIQDTLYYQDSEDPAVFGEIRLIDVDSDVSINIDDIIGQKNYTSPNGIRFTNGLKVQFRGQVAPGAYQNQEFYVEGVGTGEGIDQRVGFVDGRAYFGPFHVWEGQKMTGPVHTGEFQQFIYDTWQESLDNPGAGGPEGAPLATTSIFGAPDGCGIVLIPVTELLTPETYTENEQILYDSLPYDVGNYDVNNNAPLVPDYITINRASADRNAWSRSNRWFHIDVINYVDEINGITPVIDNNQRAKRPIIEFRANMHLFQSGTQAKQPINIIDFAQTDALSNVNGTLGYGVDGYNLQPGSRIIFAADLDPAVRNRIYEVEFVDPDNIGVEVINLTPARNGNALLDQMVVSLNGATRQGTSWYFNGIEWLPAQQKTRVNQPPLFDVFDTQGRSFGDLTVYPSSTFAGNRLFGYAEGASAIVDSVLGISLRYLNINNVGDILFTNYFYDDTFLYVQDRVSIETPVSQGFARQYLDRVSFSSLIGWQTAAVSNRSRQTFRFVYDGAPLLIDVPVVSDYPVAATQIFVEGVFVDPNRYIVTLIETGTRIDFVTPPADGAVIEVLVISDQVSSVGFYQVPLNLENNALNGNSRQFTLGTMRTYYDSVAQNLPGLIGPSNGSNNSRDLGNIIPYGSEIVQHSSPLTLAGVSLRRSEYELFDAIDYNSREYQKYKALLLDLAGKGDFINLTATQVLDEVTQEISVSRTETFPFYWSDMLPTGETYTETVFTYTPISIPTFDTTRVYDFSSSNYQALSVYLNGEILIRGYDYSVPEDTATVVVSRALTVGDVITIREYDVTYGSYVPNTPSKLGLYPAFKPEIFIDDSYLQPTPVIRGHDGSITVAFGDFRDQVLLEFEIRIFNNIKISSAIPLVAADVIPGKFRDTGFSLADITSILLPDFLNWVGANKLNYTTQTYQADNGFTYNYSQSGDKLDGEPLLGAWRGNYSYFYDTIYANTRPWEMLGLSQEPDWWESFYGPAPYTSGNLVLWRDLEQGLIRDPNNPRRDPRYARPGLTDVIPSGEEGALLPPLDSIVGNYDGTSFRRSWAFGDGGPVENVWRTSSAWPFAVMRLLALTKPAQFFSLFVDRDRYVYDEGLQQYLWDQRYRLDASNLGDIYGSGVSKASYLNWIVDYNQQRGENSSAQLTTTLDNIDIRLCWRMAGFSDKKYLKVYTERSTPSATNTSLLLPDESYQILLYQNQTLDRAVYSSVIVQVVDDGYAVFGYSPNTSYFEVLASKPRGRTVTIEAGGSSERVSVEYTNTVVQVPYGFVFNNRSALCDFLISYGQLLADRGFVFDTAENGYVMNWTQMAQEFLYWSNQGWAPGSIINLNPGATRLQFTRPGQVVENTRTPRLDSIILDQNRQAISPANLVYDREENTFRVSALGSSTLNYVNLRLTAYEHLMVLDNRSIFADLIYDPITGARQSRVLVNGVLSAEWNGTVNAPGFVLNQDNVPEWRPNQRYTKGQIVLFKDEYWSASTIINPSEIFEYSLWIKSDFDQIQTGLLPNSANASDQLANAYSVYNANLEQEIDLFSYGLVGFRPRQYMQALNLDDVSQVNLYKQFLGSKGTRPSAEIFSFADLGKEIAEYEIYEYWSLLRSAYGANANRSYFEVLLNPTKLTSNPSTVQVIQPGDSSDADQTVLVNNLWKSSYKITSPDILPTTTVTAPDVSLPSAGYVNRLDADITVFDISDPGPDIAANIDNIGVGTLIWAAKVNDYDWGIFRAEKVPGDIIRVQDNLNDSSIVTFNANHGLIVGDKLIIKYIDPDIDGIYIVNAVPSLTTVLIDYAFVGSQVSVTGTGVGLTLQSSRVAQPADIAGLPFVNELFPGIKIWVDDDGAGRWEVLEKNDIFAQPAELRATLPEVGSRFGTAISQGLFNLTAFVGAPGLNPNSAANAPGGIYSYRRTEQNQYSQSAILSLTTPEVVGYGNAIDVGDQLWAVAGASASRNNTGYATVIVADPASPTFEQRQLLVPADQDFADAEFGAAVTMSLDERWLYVGAPGTNKVYAYTRNDVEVQSVTYITDGNTQNFNYSDRIVIDANFPEQLRVSLGTIALVYGDDYTISSDDVVLNIVPDAGQALIITRRFGASLDSAQFRNVTATTDGSGVNAKFFVRNTRGEYTVTVSDFGINYNVNDLLTIDQADVETPDSPAPPAVTTFYLGGSGVTLLLSSTVGIQVGMVITGIGFESGQFVTEIVSAGEIIINALPDSTPLGGLTFNHDIKILVTSITVDGGINSFVATGAGVTNNNVFALDTYFATVDDIYSFGVSVDGALQRPYIDYSFDSGSTEITFLNSPPAGADIVAIASSYFDYVNVITTSSSSGDRFGASISTTTDGATLIVGAPGRSNAQGRAYVFSRNVQAFTVTDADETEFDPVRPITVPSQVQVNLNGAYLRPDAFNVDGEFSVIGSPGSYRVDISVPLTVGDVVELGTNQFDLVEVIDSVTPAEDNQFGYVVDQCVNNCSLYASSPYESSLQFEAGQVEFFQNQARIYGTITSDTANPVLTSGHTLRLNNWFVECTGTTVADLVTDINDAAVPNVIATVSSDLFLTGTGRQTVFEIGNIYSAARNYNTVVFLDATLLTAGVDYTYDNELEQITFTSAPPRESSIRVVSGRITISVRNFEASQPLNRLNVLPGTGTLYNDLTLDMYVHQQTIRSPYQQARSHFGEAVFISDNTTTLLVGAPDGDMIESTTFDNDTTRFDSNSTEFIDITPQSGVVYSFDALPSANPSINNPLQFVFGQQFTRPNSASGDRFGQAIDYTTGIMLAGAPGNDLEDSTSVDYGRVLEYINNDDRPAWQVLRRQVPAVDVNLMNTVFMYNVGDNVTKEYFDYFNPLQGRLLGVVRQNLDFIGGVDPAAYNQGPTNNYGLRWGQEQVGRMWWDTTNCRFVDPNQGLGTGQTDIVYASSTWGQLFKGSTVDVYQWVSSTVPPSEYEGPGVPRDTASFVTSASVDSQGFLNTIYYFWVSGITTVNRQANKTLSAATITQYIDNPKSSGLPYIAPISSDAVAIYNAGSLLTDRQTAIYIEFDREFTEAAVHVEYQLIAQDRPDSFLRDELYRKFLDSLTGLDQAGNLVPDPLLSPSELYGVQFRPRQSMFVNRFFALQNYITLTNSILAKYPISEIRRSLLLDSAEPEPSAASGAWNKRVLDRDELSYQLLERVPFGYRYLVASDSDNDGLWTIYQVFPGFTPGSRRLVLVRVQNFDTRKYWQRVDWFRPGFNPATRIVVEVPNASELDALSLPNGSAVKVTANSNNRWEIYLKENATWQRVGLQQGTIEFSNLLWNYTLGRYGYDVEVYDAQYFDQEPTVETRKILEAINQEILIDDLAIERNRLLITMFNYILSEQETPNWLTKTSLIDVDHVIRNLEPFQIYRQDNQDFVLDYINEVKPYHVQIREFNLKYQGIDTYFGSLVDFDLPAYFDSAQNRFISPILDDTGLMSPTSSVPANSPIWQTFPYNQWFENYTLTVESVVVARAGSGYISPPVVTVVGQATRPAQLQAIISSDGRVLNINVIDPGSGYVSTPTIVLESSTGSGAEAAPIMGNAKVRNLLTRIKYDRYQYQSTIQPWQANAIYSNGDRVRYADRVWEATAADSALLQSETFDPEDWTVVPAGDLSGVDRTMGYYVPTVNQPGLDLQQLITGVEYPGVQVQAPDFNRNTGFDVGNFEINTFDNISFGPEGLPTYDPAILDAIYESPFTDPFLGTRPTDINVDGGAFVDTFESHAPEELVPGIAYDTLDFRVFTTPGADWQGQGHGFPQAERTFFYQDAATALDWSNILDYPVQLQVFNQTSNTELYLNRDYTVNWVNHEVTVTTGAQVDDVIVVRVFELGGGNQLVSNSYLGEDLTDSVFVSYPSNLVNLYVVFRNGVQDTNFTVEQAGVTGALLVFATPFTANERVIITALGSEPDGAESDWSVPLTQYIESLGVTEYALVNSLQGTNPANIIVSVNGKRARPSEGIEYISDGSSTNYMLPNQGKYNLNIVADNDVTVWKDNVLQTQGVDYLVDPDDDSSMRGITFFDTPAEGSRILISVRTFAQYWILGDLLVFRPSQGLFPSVGSVIAVTTFNDTRQQNLLTQVFVGPFERGSIVWETWDSLLWDQGSTTDDPGSWDYSEGRIIESNLFDVGRIIDNPDRATVTLDGNFLFSGQDFVVEDTNILILGPTINNTQIVAVTTMTPDIVPNTMAFRIFQDMRGRQEVYRISPSTSTVLAQPLTSTDDIIYVADASRMSLPNLDAGLFGLITINGEKISYRTRDLAANTLSGLRRGISGTGAANHASGAAVYDIGVGNVLPLAYQDREVTQNFLGTGTTTVFTANDITLTGSDQAVLIYVGGILQQGGYLVTALDPVTVQFFQAPDQGYQVSIRVRQGVTWYQAGASTASNGEPLQVTNTPSARFLRGAI